MGRLSIRMLVISYVGLLVGVPVFFVFQKALSHGFAAYVHALNDPLLQSAFWLSIRVVLIAVPIDVFFGVFVALWIARHPSRFTRVLETLIDIPLAVSPIIIGLVLILTYGQQGWIGKVLAPAGIHLMFSLPGIVLASVFVSLPLVARQLIPTLREVGDHQEKTAETLGAGPIRIFLTITLRSITWALAYGVSLTVARVIGEFGAVLIVSGNVQGLTQTLTLNIGMNFENFNQYEGFVGASLLACISLLILGVINVARRRERSRHERVA